MIKLIERLRSIRDESLNSVTCNDTPCEVIFTYLESLTTNNRDISLDYKLPGPLLSNTLPNVQTRATFNNVEKSLRPNVTCGKGNVLIPKTSCSVFTSTNINYVLKNLNIEQLVICGQLTDQCVFSAVRDAADLGYFVSVVEEACAALSEIDHRRGIAGMEGFARIVTTNDILNELYKSNHTVPGIQQDSFHNLSSEMNPSLKQLPSSSQITPTSAIKKHISLIKDWRPLPCTNYCIEPLLHTLQYANIKFLRFPTIDISNSIRTKAIPIENLLRKQQQNDISCPFHLQDQTSIAKVCIGGLPSYADVMVPESNLDARQVLIVRPDLSSLKILPYTSSSAMVFGTLHERKLIDRSNLDSIDNISGRPSEYCTRTLLQRVVHTAKEQFRIGFGVGVGAEIEFILVRKKDSVRRGVGTGEKLLDIIEPVDTTVFATPTTLNEQDKFMNEVYKFLRKQNIQIETFHSESAPGQLEIVLPYQTNVLKLADMLVWTRETIKACAKKLGLHALFSPKVCENAAGNGMHVHLSLVSLDEKNPNLQNIFPSQEPHELLSPIGESFLEGILHHLHSLLSLTMPTANSFRRVGRGCWTGHSTTWAVEDKESPLRVCLDLSSSLATNVEFKFMDNTCNIYLALATLLFAGMDGIFQEMKLRPMNDDGTPTTNNMDAICEKGRQDTCVGDSNMNNDLPQSLEESLNYLSSDELLAELMGKNLLQSYIAIKKAEILHSSDLSIIEEVKKELNR
jgi:glutamine synthetase